VRVDEALARARPVAEGGPWVHLLAEEATRAAADANPDAPLAGWPLAVKDLFAVRGLPIGAGTALRADAAPEAEDAAAVAALRSAGAAVMGSVALHELAFGVTGINKLGTPDNPRMPGHIPGGSSSGSAVAVADGSARLALGTDTGGSIRIPAAVCSVVGFKPAFGTYPMQGVLPLAPSMDHVGVFAATVADVATAHAALVDSEAAATGGRMVGLLRRQLEDADPAVAGAIETAVGSLGALGYRFRDVELKDQAGMVELTAAILFPEAAATYAPFRDRWERDLGPDVCERLLRGAAMTPADYERGLREREQHAANMRALLGEVDLLLGPTVPILPPTFEEAGGTVLAGRMVENTRLANFIGIPALSLPVSEGECVGLQLMGASNGSVLANGAEIERALR
jgi:Asp-tRNA(Asn)/Glu-tRNA(Gln) amidotransferase A subunit family amidase